MHVSGHDGTGHSEEVQAAVGCHQQPARHFFQILASPAQPPWQHSRRRETGGNDPVPEEQQFQRVDALDDDKQEAEPARQW